MSTMMKPKTIYDFSPECVLSAVRSFFSLDAVSSNSLSPISKDYREAFSNFLKQSNMEGGKVYQQYKDLERRHRILQDWDPQSKDYANAIKTLMQKLDTARKAFEELYQTSWEANLLTKSSEKKKKADSSSQISKQSSPGSQSASTKKNSGIQFAFDAERNAQQTSNPSQNGFVQQHQQEFQFRSPSGGLTIRLEPFKSR